MSSDSKCMYSWCVGSSNHDFSKYMVGAQFDSGTEISQYIYIYKAYKNCIAIFLVSLRYLMTYHTKGTYPDI